MEINESNFKSTTRKLGNNIKNGENVTSIDFIYIDMNVYNESTKNEALSTQDWLDNEENISLYDLKHLRNKYQEKNNFDATYFECEAEKVSLERNIKEKGKKRKHKLKAKISSKKSFISHCVNEIQNKGTECLDKKQYACKKCKVKFFNQTKFILHKTMCKNYFCSQLKNKLLKDCKKKPLKFTKKKFCCDNCGDFFLFKGQLKSHLSTHCFKCQSCNEFFSEKSKLEYHISQSQCISFNAFTCDICKKTFTLMSKLKQHINAHMKNSLKLKKCLNILTDSKLQNFHNGKNNNNSDNNDVCDKSNSQTSRVKAQSIKFSETCFKCYKCQKTFKSKKLLENHLIKESCFLIEEKPNIVISDNISHKNPSETNKNDLLKCEKCFQMFTEPLKFSEHLNEGDCQKMTFSKKKYQYECDTCGSKFLKITTLKIHILNTHQGINYQCDKCGLKFICEEHRNRHTIQGKCNTEEPCTCKTCGKVFAKRDYLKKHQYTHTNLLFKCKYCYCAFMKEKNYKKHIEKMNCSKSARKIKMAEFNFKKCRICKIEYETEEILLEHFKALHPGQEPHQCFCCESFLPTFQDLEIHIHQHNIQKYTCNLCGKPYTSQEGFRKHRLKHKGAEFKCKFCDSEFLNENRFKFHEKTCKKNPQSGYVSPNDQDKFKKKENKPKQSRQLHWESRIIMKHLRGDPNCTINNEGLCKNTNSLALNFFDEPETEVTNQRGWFDIYYKTEEDDIAFGLKNIDEVIDDSSKNSANELLQKESHCKTKDNLSPFLEPDDTLMKESENFETDNNSADQFTTDSSEEDEDVEEVDLPIDYNPKKCRICIITFDQEYELLHHFIKTHPGEQAHKCPQCEVQSPLFAQLKEHMKSHGIGIGIFNCDNCSKKFKNERKMKNHCIKCKGLNVEEFSPNKKGYSPAEKEVCKKCGKKFHSKFGYRRHKPICKGDKNVQKQTELEIKNFSSNKVLEIRDKNAKLSDFEEEKKNSGIQEASEVNNLKKEDQSSEELVEPFGEEKGNQPTKNYFPAEPPLDSFSCRLCDKKFQYERGIVMHFKSSHPGHKPLVCQVCNMHLADKLKEHMKTHGIGEEFICELCGKRFNQKFLSKIHEMWHQGIEYKCNNCKQKFLNKEKMEKHIGENRCSNRQSLMRLPCDICGKSYRSKFGLSKHYITHTPKELRPVKNRMNCEYCGKWFENNNGLQRHRRIHTGERPFCCRFCPKAFAQEGNCKAHERIHTGELKPRKKKDSFLPAAQPLPAVPLQEQILTAASNPASSTQITDDVRKRRIAFYGHVRRMNPERLTNGIFRYFLNKKIKPTCLAEKEKDLNELLITQEDLEKQKLKTGKAWTEGIKR